MIKTLKNLKRLFISGNNQVSTIGFENILKTIKVEGNIEVIDIGKCQINST